MMNRQAEVRLSWNDHQELWPGTRNGGALEHTCDGPCLYALFGWHEVYSPHFDEAEPSASAVLLYIGQATTLQQRMKDHCAPSGLLNQREVAWMTYAQVPPFEDLDLLEGAMIQACAPALNSAGILNGTLKKKLEARPGQSIAIRNHFVTPWSTHRPDAFDYIQFHNTDFIVESDR